VTEKRKFEIAPMVMGDHLLSRGLRRDTYPKNLLRFACSYGPEFSTGPLLGLMQKLLNGNFITNPADQRLAYTWLTHAYTTVDLRISNEFRREIGSRADGLQISKVQLTEFYRLVLIDLINRELRQTEDEAPLDVYQKDKVGPPQDEALKG